MYNLISLGPGIVTLYPPTSCNRQGKDKHGSACWAVSNFEHCRTVGRQVVIISEALSSCTQAGMIEAGLWDSLLIWQPFTAQDSSSAGSVSSVTSARRRSHAMGSMTFASTSDAQGLPTSASRRQELPSLWHACWHSFLLCLEDIYGSMLV